VGYEMDAIHRWEGAVGIEIMRGIILSKKLGRYV
jgi:hypothetical protein